ncbi:MAG: hypothetical protein QRY72_03270 [Candidatus Rhabdochlamydia sp.]
MTCRVLICPVTFEAWIKMHTDDQGKERVEILSPRLIAFFTKHGMDIPYPYRTQEMKDKNILCLKLDELEKNPDFFTRIFKATVYQSRFLHGGYYWKDAEDYIDPAAEELEQDERERQISIAYQERRNEAVAKGIDPVQFYINDTRRSIVEKSESIYLACKQARLAAKAATPQPPSLEAEVKEPTEEMQKLTLSKRVAKTASKTHQVKDHTKSFKHQLNNTSKKSIMHLGDHKV